jgi:hypothetical protein
MGASPNRALAVLPPVVSRGGRSRGAKGAGVSFRGSGRTLLRRWAISMMALDQGLWVSSQR